MIEPSSKRDCKPVMKCANASRARDVNSPSSGVDREFTCCGHDLIAKPKTERSMSSGQTREKSANRASDRFRASDDAHGVTYSAGGRANRASSGLAPTARGIRAQVRRYPLSFVLSAAGLGMVLGGMVVAAVFDSIRPSRTWRNWIPTRR
jgi:hypothetical protein